MVELVAAGVVVLALSLIPLIMLSVRRRIGAQEAQLPNPTSTQYLPAKPIDNTWQYVATTLGDERLTRLWAYGLWQRGWCSPQLRDGQLVIHRRGAACLVIDSSSLLDVVTGSATIGRGVEAGGLLGVVWKTSDLSLTTWLRAISPEQQRRLRTALESELV